MSIDTRVSRANDDGEFTYTTEESDGYSGK